MIKSITVKSGLLFDVFKGERTFNFNPGLNFIVGRNGTGKSLLLKTIQEYFPCEFIKPTKFTDNVTDKNGKLTFDRYLEKFHTRAEFNYIGGGVKLFEASKFADKTGRFNEAQETGKNFGEILVRMASKHSDGEDMIKGIGKLVKFTWSIDNEIEILKKYREEVNYRWQEAIDLFIDYHNRFHNAVKPTLLLDEYDNHLDLDSQWTFIKTILPELSKRYQIICVSHSILAHFEDNVISLDDSTERYKKYFTLNHVQ